MMLFKLILFLVILALLAIFAIENGGQKVKINFINYESPEVSVVVIIIISTLLGVLLTIPVYMKLGWDQMQKVRKKKKEIKDLEKEKKKRDKEQKQQEKEQKKQEKSKPKSLPPAIIENKKK